MDLLVALRAIVALAAVLGLLFWLSRRLQKGHESGGNPLAALVPKKLGRLTALMPAKSASAPRRKQTPERINVVARTGLSGKTQLVVAEFGGIRYVLGVTEEAPPAEEEADAVIATISSAAGVEGALLTPSDLRRSA
jgi:flagellar protein FliO/FliZ